MRLRLRIERNLLPAVSILWAIGDTELKQTVSQFLERVNQRFPIESESWGLEDYAVTVGGYEALHYSEVGISFQSEDEVVIKPLQFVDARARTITGRAQISQDGRHLIDGVPFGRPLLKTPTRPRLRIPPRRRPRFQIEHDVQDEEEEHGALVRFSNLGDDEEEDDVDFELDDDLDEDEDEEDSDSVREALDVNRALQQGLATNDDEDESEEDKVKGIEKKSNKRKMGRPVMRNQFIDNAVEADAQVDSEEEDSLKEDEALQSSDEDGSETSSSEDESNDESSSDSTSSEDEDAEEWEGIQFSGPVDPRPQTNGRANPANERNPALRNTSSEAPVGQIPFQGKTATQIRNARRREQRQLKYLKEAGMLPKEASLDDLRQTLNKTGLFRGPALRQHAHRQKLELERQKLLGEIASGGVDVTPGLPATNSTVLPDADEEGPSEEAIDQGALIENVVDVQVNEEFQASMQKRTKNAKADEESEETWHIEASVPAERKRIDLAGTNRLVFGSLGVRTPKTQVEKDALQKKLATRPKRTALVGNAGTSEQTTEGEQAADEREDPEAWREKLELSAVECCDEDIILSAPPFPFQQRWDPQYQKNPKKRNAPEQNAGNRRKKRRAQDGYTMNGEYVESYDKYNKAGGSDALNYDDPEEEEDDSYWEDGALLDEEYEAEEVGALDQPVDDGFPALPADITLLPPLAEADARKGDYVVYTELACSAATDWQPKMITRTVRLESQDADDNCWTVKLAQRDRRRKEFDDDGNRVYSKFEMADASDDDDEDDSLKLLAWIDMQEPRRLLPSVSE